jgi:hypothetical protein
MLDLLSNCIDAKGEEIMFRRRPLARAAVIGGAGVYAGRKSAQAAQREASQEARIAELEAEQAAGAPAPAAAAPAPSGGLSDDAMARLQQLAKLHEQGVLTDAEFDVQKQKILQGM